MAADPTDAIVRWWSKKEQERLIQNFFAFCHCLRTVMAEYFRKTGREYQHHKPFSVLGAWGSMLKCLGYGMSRSCTVQLSSLLNFPSALLKLMFYPV